MLHCISMSRVCLVLEGGGNRGAYTSGVLDAFLDSNIDIKSVYGVSAGALNALSYLSKQKGRSLLVNKQVVLNDKYISYKNILNGKNVVNLDKLLDLSNTDLPPFDLETFNQREKYVVTCTNVLTGAPVYKEITDYNSDVQYIKASASLPLFSKIVEVDSLKLLDGGISDSIPVLKAINDGYDKVVVVLTRDKDYVSMPYKLLRAYKIKYFKYRNLLDTMSNRFNKYNVTRDLIENYEKEKKVIAIYPSQPLVIKNLEKDENKIDEIYKLGYEDAMSMISKIKQFVGEEKHEQEQKSKR